VVHSREQRRVLHVELALLLCRRLSWWVGSTRKRHHEPAGAPGLDEKEPDWIKHQGHDLLPRQSVGHLVLLGELGSTRSSLFGGSSGQSSGVGGGGGGQGSMWTPGSSTSGGQSSSAWSSRGIGAEQSSSNWSSSSRGYRTDRLMQMD